MHTQTHTRHVLLAVCCSPCAARPFTSCAALNTVEHEEGTVGTAELLSALTSHGWVIDFRQQVGEQGGAGCRVPSGHPLGCCLQDAHELFQVLLSSLDDELV